MSKHKGHYRNTIALECQAQNVPSKLTAPLCINLIFQVPDARKRDDDNLIAAFKSGRDAIANHVGVDDADWIVSYKIERTPITHGAVWCEFTSINRNVVCETEGKS